MIEAINISKFFGEKQALKEVSIKAKDGKIFGLLGPNGAGKTTLIRILVGINKTDTGHVLIDGNDLSQLDQNKIGYLPEERGLYRKMTVQDQLLYLGQLKGLSKQEAEEAMNEWLERFDILDWKKKSIEQLSKGMAQKIQFISTVLHDPDIIILDEPFSGFDPGNAEQIKKEILRLKKLKKCIILSTHNMNSVEELCDDILLLNESEVVLKGATWRVRKKHRDLRFKIVFEGNMISFSNALWTGFELLHHNTQEDGKIAVTIKAVGEREVNDLLAAIMPYCKIWSVAEAIPSMHEIFLKNTSPIGEKKALN